MPANKKLLIISPHYPPSNLAAVHRSRLFAQHLPSFGWEPIVLTVHEDYYEEALDHNLERLLPKEQRIEKVKAWRVTKPRLIGDIGLRAFFQLRKRAVQLVKEERIDFVYIPIPSFYAALLGPYIKRKTGVAYGIDYIDPWVHRFPGSDRLFSRHWFSTQLAQWLEPKAVKHCSLITGVAQGYYEAVLQRNPQLRQQCITGAMPYGGEAADHEKVKELSLTPYLFQKNKKLQLVYAGAMLPKAYQPLEQILQVIAVNRSHFENVEFHFIGTGKTPNDPEGFNIKPLAEKYSLWESVVFEYPKRIPYLDVLTHLEASDGVFILGSTEAHYTPSKTYQAVLSKKPVLAVLNAESTAVEVLRIANAGEVLDFAGENDLNTIGNKWMSCWERYLDFYKKFDPHNVNREVFNRYSARAVTKELADLLNQIPI
ncbi:hypothetical protein PDL71_03850 [Lacibacter sp. MH-610]|uniref:hypothetical protein n=1 Tax=Lacibacter sp. MH-610 TaxID=3020883 RepID=UPI0038921B61